MKDRLKVIRKELAKSQDDFAQDVGVSLSNIKSYEIGRRCPSEAFIQLICNKYGISETWLRTGEGEMKIPLTREAEIAQITSQMFKDDESSFRYQLQLLISQMSEEEIALLRDMAKRLATASDIVNDLV